MSNVRRMISLADFEDLRTLYTHALLHVRTLPAEERDAFLDQAIASLGPIAAEASHADPTPIIARFGRLATQNRRK